MEAATIQAAQAGHKPSQAQLLRLLQDPWYRVCLSLLSNPDDAREATQETALRFLRDLPRFAGHSQLKTWSIGIAINVCREIRRQRHPADLDSNPDMQTSEPSPADMAGLAEERRRLHALLADLPPRQREAVVLRYFEDLSVEQTAAAMQCAPGTIKATVHQALRALKRRLQRVEI